MVIAAVTVWLSTVALALPLPPVAPAVNVALADPPAPTVVAAPERLPSTGAPKLMATPTRAARSEGATAAPPESVRKSAVSVVDAPVTMVDGLARCVNTRRGLVVAVPLTVSQPALPGPALQPHQSRVAVAVPLATKRPPPAATAVLPTMRLNESVSAPTPASVSSAK